MCSPRLAVIKTSRGPTAKSLSTWAFLFSTVYFLWKDKENGGRKKAHVSFEILAVGELGVH